jgi:hypothetical protein
MSAQKMREEVTEKERDGHFKDIRPVIPMIQEWRMKEKVDTPAPKTSDDDMDLLDNDEAPLIKDGYLPLIGMDINMVFTLPAEFRGAEEEVAQICLGPKEDRFGKPKESSQHLKPLYIWGHINGNPISMMLVDGSAIINLMSSSVFKKVGREDDKLVKTNLAVNGVWGNMMEARVSSLWSSP